MRKIIIPLFLLLVALAIVIYGVYQEKPAEPPISGEISVHFIDVGQGDAILIDCGTTEILIDGGDRSSGIAEYLEKYVDGNLEIVIATHAHADHIGGLPSVLERFTVEQVWYDGYTYSSKTFTDFIAASTAGDTEIHIAKRGDIIGIENLSLHVLHPDVTSSDLNNNSIVLSFQYGAVSFLFTGDAEKKAEQSMLASPFVSIPNTDILKVGHHGSRTSSTAEFLYALMPEVAVYMAKTDNSYGHPHPETIEALLNIGADIYGTDTHGTIIITTDGETYFINTAK
ncbi:MAG: ComEC/Rec2 family competence protein [Dehalococcoidales bacterium]